MVLITMSESILAFWAKTDERSDQVHPLLFHLIDANEVAQEMWQKALPDPLKNELASALDLPVVDAGKLISFWIALHDLGKASPAFQGKHGPSKIRLEQMGFSFPPVAAFDPRPHGLVTGWIISTQGEALGLPPEEAEALARALSGHHGIWPDSHTFINDPSCSSNLGDKHWRKIQRTLIDTLRLIYDPPKLNRFPPEGADRNIFLTIFSGLTSVADWLASMQSTFPPVGTQYSPDEYLVLSHSRAETVVLEQGWHAWDDPSGGTPITFQQAFPHLGCPRPLQSEVFDRANNTALPVLALIEAPTGIGKTEIAFLLADRWMARSNRPGFYVAMPTQATSNQIYGRAIDFLSRCYPNVNVNFHLVHGHAILSDQYEKTIVYGVGDDHQTGIGAAAWFLPRKRTLLAPFAVGTVDQVFLSVLQTRHFFVRLFGLYGKVLVFDEVHAYDAYQSELFCRLLAWLRALKVSVILLSATLPAKVRGEFIAAYGGATDAVTKTEYPRLTLVENENVRQYTLPPGESRPVYLDRLGSTPADVVRYLRAKLDRGGCAAVICNTVSRAQAIYQAVKEDGVAPGNTFLFHARFPFAWREQMEQKVLARFGPNGQQRHGIVIATQVIEQSLDLDFDLMVSELAPIDLLIQRAGRLHRHARTGRPTSVSEPHLGLIVPPRTPDGDPDFGSDAYIYRPYHLLRTELVLHPKKELLLPKEAPTLIELVYGDQDLEVDDHTASALRQSKDTMQKAIQESKKQARRRIVPAPESDDLLTRPSDDLDEDAPTVHKDFQALTREAPPGVNLVCLNRLPDGRTVFEPSDPTTMIDVNQVPSKQEIKNLLRYTVQSQRPELVGYISGRLPFAPWQGTPALRYHYPVIFVNGKADLDDFRLCIELDRELGLRITKEAA